MIYQDVLFGLRFLAKYRGSSLVIILTLAAGIGLNTAMFSIVNAVLLRALPYPASDQLVQVQKEWCPPWVSAPEITPQMDVAEIVAWRRENQVFSQLGVYEGKKSYVTGASEGWEVKCERVSGSLLSMLGAVPRLGRNFTAEEESPGGAPVVILSHGYWTQHFGRDESALGRTLTVDDQPLTIIGVLPPGFRLPEPFDICVPLRLRKGDPAFGGFPGVVGRLKTGIGLKQAESALETIYRAVGDPKEKGRIMVVRMQDHLVAPVRLGLLVYVSAVGFVLLIACANVANLQLARSVRRRKEIAIRLSLGADRARIFQQLMTESLLLALLGAALGLACAFWWKPLLAATFTTLPGVSEIRIDGSVLAFTMGLSLLTSIGFGLLPAWEASRTDLSNALKAGTSQGAAGLLGHHHATSLLAVSEVTMALVLLTGAGLLIKTFLKIQAIDLGFNPERILTFTVTPKKSPLTTPLQRLHYYEEVLGEVQRVPDLEVCAAGDVLPLTYGNWTGTISCRDVRGFAGLATVNSNYFRTLGIALKKGRVFSDQDRGGSLLVTVVNQAFVDAFLKGQEPLGQTVAHFTNQLTIIGVVGDVIHWSYADPPMPHIYFHHLQSDVRGMLDNPSMSFALRTRGNPLLHARELRARVQALDRNAAITGFVTLTQLCSNMFAPQRLNMFLSGALGLVALGLATLGIYSVLSFSVVQRMKEMGVRMALGAQGRDLIRLVLREGLVLAVAGIFFGCFAAYYLTWYLGSLLYDVQPLDVSVFLGASVFILLVCLADCYQPARRASRVDPIITLQSE